MIINNNNNDNDNNTNDDDDDDTNTIDSDKRPSGASWRPTATGACWSGSSADPTATATARRPLTESVALHR